ncbi:gamma-glutamyl-gamma-aminobutyrate hydrolase family protein [bacterium]|nr:gamma-glutamyl-gamma-aminobutyrate hydrolase family protein [bacterium]
MKVLIVNGSGAYTRMYTQRGHTVTNNMDEADLIQFTGGEDVSPSLYGEAKHPATFNSEVRDHAEKKFFEHAVANGIPVAGICRGGQFLNVVNGGKMWQHVDNHAIGGTHELVDVDTNKRIQVTSTHHQMMRAGHTGKVVAYAESLSTFRQNMVEGEVSVCDAEEYDDVEVVYYDNTNSLCFQPHPEFMVESCADYYFELLERCLGVK